MATTFLPVLAFNEIELIVGAIGVIILFGNWVAKRLKESNAKQQVRQPSDSTSNLTLEQMAQRRREQLRAQSQGGTPPTAATSQPGQAKTLYERRAEALRRARQQQGGQQQPTAAEQNLEAQRRHEAEQRLREQQQLERRERIEAQAKQRLEQQQRLEKQRRLEAAERRRRADRMAELEKHRPASHRHESTPAERARTHELANRPTTSETRRRVDDADSSAYEARQSKRQRAAWLNQALSGPESLRRAIVLAEVLGKPVALREPGDSTI